MSNFIVPEKKKSLHVLHILHKELYKIQTHKVYSKNISLVRAVCLKNFFKQNTATIEMLHKLLQTHMLFRKRLHFVESFYNCMIEKLVYDPNTVHIIH